MVPILSYLQAVYFKRVWWWILFTWTTWFCTYVTSKTWWWWCYTKRLIWWRSSLVWQGLWVGGLQWGLQLLESAIVLYFCHHYTSHHVKTRSCKAHTISTGHILNSVCVLISYLQLLSYIFMTEASHYLWQYVTTLKYHSLYVTMHCKNHCFLFTCNSNSYVCNSTGM